MKNKNNREAQVLRHQISAIKDVLSPILAISYKVSEIPKVYDIYGEDIEILLAVRKKLYFLLDEAVNFGLDNQGYLKTIKNIVGGGK